MGLCLIVIIDRMDLKQKSERRLFSPPLYCQENFNRNGCPSAIINCQVSKLTNAKLLESKPVDSFNSNQVGRIVITK